MPRVGFTGDVEVEFGVFRVTFEEELEEGVDVFGCVDGVGDFFVVAVGEADVDGLDERCMSIGVRRHTCILVVRLTWSRKMTLASLFHEDGLLTVALPVGATRQGPSSMKRPVRDEQPGPPLSHRMTGSLAGSRRLSKNQKKNCLVYESSQSRLRHKRV